MKSQDVRKKYLEFFNARGHVIIPSAPLIPENDPTTLFNSSGMQPLVPYLLGQVHPLGKRLVNSQKAVRLQDIEEVGDNRHTTFFEMLGNWSLGDYFKKEQLPWIFEFLTKELGLDPKRLYVTVFEGNQSVGKDTESIALWKAIFAGVGIDAREGERIFAYPAKKNWWSRSGEPEKMPPGEPGGPDSEVFFDFGAELKLHEQSPWKDEKCHPNCDCGRFMEIANSVFMQYKKEADGSLKELSQQNVDFGGGLERMVAATEDTSDVFKTDLFAGVIDTIQSTTGKSYDEDPESRPLMRIIADHIRAAVIMIKDGVVPSNKAQGYILRRILRRAAMKMYQLSGILASEHQMEAVGESVLSIYDGVYLDKVKDKKKITEEVGAEVFKFSQTLKKGLKELEGFNKIDGKGAFYLYQSFGFPWELTVELVTEKGQTVDRIQFEEEFKKHQELSRTAAKGMFKGGLADHSEETTKLHTATHLLHKALRTILGTHVSQKGSNITAERLRFDFSHQSKITSAELVRIEKLVNETIQENLPVSFEVLEKDAAIQSGAMAFFGERYGDKVKVYTVGDPKGAWFSREICGGPHVDFTGTLGHFRITKEESAGAGIRRIYATVSK